MGCSRMDYDRAVASSRVVLERTGAAAKGGRLFAALAEIKCRRICARGGDFEPMLEVVIAAAGLHQMTS